ncbi:adhesion G protein-coupled receptor E3-like isoform X2 [Scyliorhinus torazame]
MKTGHCLVLHAIFIWILWNQNIHESEASQINGELRSSVTLPCSYDVKYHGMVSMCWGRGKCLASFSCDDILLTTDGRRVTSNVGPKYKLYGDIERGNVSLTIHGLNLGDEGWYCCRVEFSGLFNDLKQAISLGVYQARPFKCFSDNGSTDSVAECQSDSQLSKSRSDSTFCRFMNFTTELDREMCNGSGAAFPAKKIIELAARLLSDVTVWESVKDSERQRAASRFLETMESAVIAIALGLQKDGETNWTHPTLDVQIGFIKRDNIGSDMMTLQAKGNTLNVHPSTVIGDDDSALLAFMSYSDLESIMSANLEKDESTDLQKPQQSQFYSKVVTVTKGNRRSHELNGTVNITFKEIQGKQGGVTDSEKFCTFWKSSAEGGYWSTSGCRLTTSNGTHTECSCSHLSSFAVLMALYEIEDPFHSPILSWISFIGLPISLVCLLLSMGTFFCCQSIQNLNTTIRTHLCLSLFLAELLFLVTSSINKRTVFCSIAAGAVHYLFLATFVWMLLEAVQLFLMVLNLKVVNFSRARVIRRRFIYPIGYGCPALIVVMCAAVNAEGYGTDTSCWLNLEKGFLWSFLGPVCFVIVVNAVLFSITLWILRGKISNLNASVSKINDSRMLTIKAVAQFALLGCSWVFGVFQVQEGTIVMSYLFTTLNVVQGVFIFCVYCLLNSKVRKEYWKCFSRICRPNKAKMSDLSTSTLNTTNTTNVVALKTVNVNSLKPDVSWMNSDVPETLQN